MPISFGSSINGNDNLKECVEQLLFATGGDVGKLTQVITESIEGIPTGGEIGGDVGAAISDVAGGVTQISSNIEKFREGLPLSEVIPSNQLRPPINVRKTASDITNDLQSRCTDFVLSALDQLNPLDRLEKLLDLVKDLCNQLNFSDMRKVLDKIDQTQQDIVNETVEAITDPLEKAAKLNDMLVDAVNSGAQDTINAIDNALEQLKYDQLYDYINQLDPDEAIARLQAEIKKRTQLGDIKGVRDMLSAISSVESTLQEGIQTALDTIQDEFGGLIPSVGELFDLPSNVINTAQDKIDDALNIGNYEEISNVISAVESVETQLLGTLQDLDPQTLLKKGTALLNEALEKADLGRYNRILDEMAQKLCTQSQLDSLPSIPNIPNIELPSAVQ